MSATTDYTEFLASKRVVAEPVGFDVAPEGLNAALFPFQRDIVRWALRRGRAAIFADCGLGKTPMQLEWAWRVTVRTGRPVLILAPLAVGAQTAREGEKFGIRVTACRRMADVRAGVNVANYEMLPHFDAALFGGVVLDESSILKAYMGKTKRQLIETFARTPFKLACTATPAPNDHMELGNHSDFLGVMPASEMLTRWFINDTHTTGVYRLKGHAVRSFYDWLATWAAPLRRPGDLGYPDDGFMLPPLGLHQLTVPVDLTEGAGPQLFRTPTLNATGLHRELRLTAPARAQAVADLVNASAEPWAVWCNANYEADELVRRIPDAVEVRGNDPLDRKERTLRAFSDGEARVIVTKPSIAGHGLNWQHCARTAFVGLSYSFEQFYQAVRRVYRFGQSRPVEAYVVAAETEGPILAAVRAKIAAHERMMDGMTASAAKLALERDLSLAAYATAAPLRLPPWLTTLEAA